MVAPDADEGTYSGFGQRKYSPFSSNDDGRVYGQASSSSKYKPIPARNKQCFEFGHPIVKKQLTLKEGQPLIYSEIVGKQRLDISSRTEGFCSLSSEPDYLVLIHSINLGQQAVDHRQIQGVESFGAIEGSSEELSDGLVTDKGLRRRDVLGQDVYPISHDYKLWLDRLDSLLVQMVVLTCNSPTLLMLRSNIFLMRYLLEIAGNVSYVPAEVNLTQLAVFLVSVQLIALATHPTRNNLLYALYSTSPTSSYQLQAWTVSSEGRSLLSNQTLQGSLSCLTYCYMNVSQSLLLIETRDSFYVWGLSSGNKVIISPQPIKTQLSLNFAGSVAVYNNSLVYYNGSKLQVDQFTIGSNSSTTYYSELYYSFENLTYASSLSIVLSEEYIVGVGNSTLQTITYVCFPCILNGTYVNQTSIPYTSFSTNLTALYLIQLAIGNSITGSKRVWLVVDGVAYRFALGSNNLLETFESNSSVRIASSNQDYVLFDEGSFYSLVDYSNRGTREAIDLMVTPFSIAVIHTNTALISTFDSRSSTNTIKQYQIVGSCSNFQSTLNLANSTCICSNYSGIFCAQVANKTEPPDSTSSSSSSSLPSFAIPLAAVGTLGTTVSYLGVIALVSWVIYKKLCAKAKPDRTPFKYNPVELMSFEM